MNQKPTWELVDDDTQTKKPFTQKEFLFSLLGNYPRLKLAGIALVGALAVVLLAVFSLVVVTGMTVAGVVVLLAAWCKAKFFKQRSDFDISVSGK